MSDELRPKRVPQPPPGPGQLPPSALPGEGRLPMRTGQVYMSDHTKEQLRKLGWQEGDPVPGDLGTEIQRIQKRISADRDEANWEENPPPGYTKPKAKFVDIDELPAADQQQLREYLAEYKADRQRAAERLKQDEQFAAQAADMSPQMAEATATAMQQQREAELARGAQMAQAMRPPDTPPGDIELPDVPQAASPQPSPVQPAPSQPVAAEHDHATSGISELPAYCPRCFWDQHAPFEIDPTQEDKEAFIAAILGMQRMEKKYELLNGNCVVYFRSLLSDEVALLNEQLGWHIRRGEIVGDGEYFMWLMEYRLVMSLSRIVVGGKMIKSVLTLAEYEAKYPDMFDRARSVFDEDGNINAQPQKTKSPTGLYAMRHWFYKEVLTIEPVRRVVGQQHRIFQRLVEGLEARADSPDFWNGIERLA